MKEYSLKSFDYLNCCRVITHDVVYSKNEHVLCIVNVFSLPQELVRHHCMLASNYVDALDLWAGEDYYVTNVHKFQLPYTSTAASIVTAEQQNERREQQVYSQHDCTLFIHITRSAFHFN